MAILVAMLFGIFPFLRDCASCAGMGIGIVVAAFGLTMMFNWLRTGIQISPLKRGIAVALLTWSVISLYWFFVDQK